VAIDAQSVAYRGFHAMRRRPLRNHLGENTSAIYYFDNLLRDVLKRFHPTHGVVGFDSKEPTFRHRLLKEYKAQRPETPDELIPQIGWIAELSEAWGLRAVAKPGYEADDIVASAALLAKREGLAAILITSDKDMMALIDDRVRLYNVADDRMYDRDAVLKRYGLLPEQIPDYLILVGDRTDNVPGIRGIGEKTAKKLLATYGSLENILRNLKDVERRFPKVAKLLREALESGELERMRELIELRLHPFFSLSDLRIRPPDRRALVAIYRRLDFYTALKEIAIAPDLPTPRPHSGEPVKGVGYDGSLFYLGDGENLFTASGVPGAAATIDLKGMYRRGYRGRERLDDLSLADYLLQPEIEDESRYNRHDLEFMALKYMGWKLVEPKAALTAHLSALVSDEILAELKREGLHEVYERIELPLTRVLADMEEVGVKVDVDYLRRLEEELEVKLREYEERIYEVAGRKFNINSPKQLAKVLFEDLKLPPIKRTKTGYSTDVEVLTQLAQRHPLPALILSYRELFKMKSTYVQGLLKYVGDDGRIHPTFSQTTTATGRLSCYNPNLQNVPARGEWGRKIRRAFIPEEGYLFADYDYSQIELRVLAHLSGDESLRRIFYEDGDIHAETARALFGEGEITPEMRRVAKAVNFGIIYGISPYGLAKAIGVDVGEAAKMIERYYERFPRVKEWQERVLNLARERGYVETIFGRRRYIYTDPTVSDVWRRIAINTPVQGSAADIIKVAMLKIYDLLAERRSRMLLQVHDELLLEMAEDEARELLEAVKETMESAVELDVPVKVDVGTGRNWAEAHA